MQIIKLGNVEIVDVRDQFPPSGPMARQRDFGMLDGIAIHHDAVLMQPGDLDYSGSTLNEDLGRLQAISNHSSAQGWGPFPYHFMASPNNRAFYCVDLKYFGAHVARMNHRKVGVSLMGNFQYAAPGDLQLCAAARCVLAIIIWAPTFSDMRGHREWALPDFATACPGNTWWQWQNDLVVMTRAVARLAFPS